MNGADTRSTAAAMSLLQRLRFARPAGSADPVWDELAVFLRSHDDTETERKDGWWANPTDEVLRAVQHKWPDLSRRDLLGILQSFEEAQRALLASVRPKEEGV